VTSPENLGNELGGEGVGVLEELGARAAEEHVVHAELVEDEAHQLAQEVGAGQLVDAANRGSPRPRPQRWKIGATSGDPCAPSSRRSPGRTWF